MRGKNYFWGLFFITAAAVILVNQLGYFGGINLFSLVFTILLIPIIIKSLFKLNFAGVLFPLAILGIIFNKQLGIEELTPWPILATALFGSIGLWLIFKPLIFKNVKFYNGFNHAEHFDEIINTEDKSTVDLAINFGSCIKYVNTDDFKKANIRCSFGSMKVYFDNAKIDGDEAVVNLDISFGGVELYIPREWKIVNKADVSLGGIEEKTRTLGDGKKTLYIYGKVSLSGVEIIYI
jgi:predicted membrane protein